MNPTIERFDENGKVKIFTPNQKSVKDYDLGESIDVTINGQAVIPILADKIYKSPYSAIRELYVNEVTATKKALRINPNLKPEIIISLNTNNRELIIKGVNSLGIDEQTFRHILAVMGNSGNNNENETGYYGLGFYSFVKISERIIINSYSLESGEKWACVAKSALKFEKLPQGSFKPLDKTGFEITLSVKNDLDFNSIEDRIKQISMLSGVKTSLYIDGVYTELDQYDNLEDYFKKYYSEYFDNNANYSLVYEHINNDDFELILGYRAGGNKNNLRRAFLINVPIELDFPSYDFPQIALLNVKNERVFRPSADRERFSEQDEEILTERIKEHGFNYNDKITPVNNLNEWYDSPHRYFIKMVSDVDISNLAVKQLEKNSRWDKTYSYDLLNSVLPAKKPDEFRISKTFKKKQFIKYAEKNVFARQVWNEYNYDLFIEIGFIDIDDGKKTRKSSNRNYNPERKTKNFKFWNRNNSFDELPSNSIAVLRVDDVKGTNLKSYADNNIYWVTKRADYDNTIEDLSELLSNDKILFTNKGFLTVRQIFEISKRFYTYSLSNNAPELNSDNYNYDSKENQLEIKEHYASKIYNNWSSDLVIKFDNSTQSELLKTCIQINKNSWFSSNGINYSDIIRQMEKEDFQKWDDSITDTRLRELFKELDPNYNEDYQPILTSLQRSLDKNDN